MSAKRIILALSLSAQLAACAYMPPDENAEDNPRAYLDWGFSSLKFDPDMLLTSFALKPMDENARIRISQDYAASDNVQDARAYIYGERTLLEFGKAPALLVVKDETGETVEYERVGRYYRLSRLLQRFTVMVNGRSISFFKAS